MSENKHTPEPWRSEGLTILDADGHIIFRMDVSFYLPEERKEAALRIVACVNACAGIPISDLESGDFAKSLKMFALESATFRRQRDLAVEAMNKFQGIADMWLWETVNEREQHANARKLTQDAFKDYALSTIKESEAK